MSEVGLRTGLIDEDIYAKRIEKSTYEKIANDEYKKDFGFKVVKGILTDAITAINPINQWNYMFNADMSLNDVANYQMAGLNTALVVEGISSLVKGMVTRGAVRGAGETGSSKAGAEIVVYDTKFAAQQLLKDGKISIDDLNSMVRKGAPNEFINSSNIAEGYKYNYTINGSKVEIKWHSPDANAAVKFPNGNSANGWTAQIKVDGKLLGQDGNFYKKPSNITHIPVEGLK